MIKWIMADDIGFPVRRVKENGTVPVTVTELCLLPFSFAFDHNMCH